MIDNFIFFVKVEDEMVYFEVYVYEDEVDNFYVYYDIMLFVILFVVEWFDILVNKGVEGSE